MPAEIHSIYKHRKLKKKNIVNFPYLVSEGSMCAWYADIISWQFFCIWSTSSLDWVNFIVVSLSLSLVSWNGKEKTNKNNANKVNWSSTESEVERSTF